jgi:hypothetical protein
VIGSSRRTSRCGLDLRLTVMMIQRMRSRLGNLADALYFSVRDSFFEQAFTRAIVGRASFRSPFLV